MTHRPKRENYGTGIRGEYDYQESLEKYCTYLENKNSELHSDVSQAGVSGHNNTNLVCQTIKEIIDNLIINGC